MNSSEPSSAGPKPSRFWRLLPLVVLGGAFLLAAALGLEAYSLRGATSPAEQYAWQQREGNALPELWSAPSFSFVDQHGKPATERDLAGGVWIADFIYTQCTSACPLLSAKLALVRRQLTDPRVKFVSFSVDPEHDKPEVLRAYEQNWGPQDARWTLFSTDPKGLAALAQGMRVAVSPTQDPNDPILHTTLFFLVDSASKVRGAYDSSDDAALDRLVQDAQRLLGAAAAQTEVAAQSGAELYASLGCRGCHENPKVAPALAGLRGQSVQLTGGESVVADAAYLMESITAPGAKVRQGYLNLMPAYGAHLQAAQLSALVSYLEEWNAPAAKDGATKTAGAQEPARIVEDPVCHMEVRVTPDTPHFEHGGQVHYFCSESCEEKYRASVAQR
jgi:protein SCO1/2